MASTALIIFAVFTLLFLVFLISDLVKAKKRGEHFKIKASLIAMAMLIPAVVLAFIFVLLPILYSLGYAFTDYNLFHPDKIQMNGFANFEQLFTEFKDHGDIYHAFINTTIFVVLVVPLQIALALGLAIFSNRKVKGAGIFKVCFFTPVVISLTVTSYLWVQILSPSETGLLNSVLSIFNIPAQDFLNNTETAMLWIVLISAWQGCGYQMLIFLSALANIPKDLYEAASLDGANKWKQFVHITLPALRPTMLYILITVFIGACRVMVQPMLMTGYKSHTMTLSYYMYTEGYTNHWVGYSSAVALIMTIFIGAITLLQRRLLKEKK